MALIKGGKADEQENAKKFIDWMTSEAGQGCYAENDSFRVPTNTAALWPTVCGRWMRFP